MLTTFCTTCSSQFVYSGLYVVVYMHIRWPIKIVQKLVLYTGIIGHLVAYANRCVNPVFIMDFATMGRRHNGHLEALGSFKNEWKRRIIWATDHAQPKDRQMYICWYVYSIGSHYDHCTDLLTNSTYQDYVKKVYAELPEILSWTKWHYNEHYLLTSIAFW